MEISLLDAHVPPTMGRMLPNVLCPHCRTAITNDGSLADQDVACPSCQGEFQMPRGPTPPPPPPHHGLTVQQPPAMMQDTGKYCFNCGSVIHSLAVVCPNCGLAQASQPHQYERDPYEPRPKDPGVAAMLSFLWPGAGQIYAEHVGKGILLAIANVFGVILAIGTVVLAIPYLLFYVWAIYDAYNIADQSRRRRRRP